MRREKRKKSAGEHIRKRKALKKSVAHQLGIPIQMLAWMNGTLYRSDGGWTREVEGVDRIKVSLNDQTSFVQPPPRQRVAPKPVVQPRSSSFLW